MSERKEYMNLAWEIATKLSVISDETRNEIFGYSDVGRIIRNNTPDAVNFKMIQYEKKLGEEKINVGDIVQCDYLSQGVVTSIICDVKKSEEYNVLFTDGVSESYTRDKLQKTGKTVDVLKTLRELILGWIARFKTKFGGDYVKIIFLDVDGELTYSNYQNRETANIDIEKVKLVKEICDKTGLKLLLVLVGEGMKITHPKYIMFS